MGKVLLPLIICALTLLGACSQQSAAPTGPESAAGSDGLVPRASGLDAVSAAFAFDLSGASVYVAPVEIDYTKRFGTGPGHLRTRDYELDAKDRARLRNVMAEAFASRFLTPRNSHLAADRSQADYVLQLGLDNFSLAAPLEPTAWLWRVYTDQSAYGVLTGTLYDRNGNAVMRFRDRRDIGDNFGGPIGGARFERFTSVTFWSDMRVDSRRAFASLDKSLR